MGFSIPGKVDPHSAVVYHGGALPCIDGLDLKQLVHTKAPDVAVSAENDGKAGALDEYWQGSLEGHPNSAIITLGLMAFSGLRSMNRALESRYSLSASQIQKNNVSAQ